MQFANVCRCYLGSKCKMRTVEFCLTRTYSNAEAKENIIKVREALYEIYEEYVCEYQHGSEHSSETPMINSDDNVRNDKASSSDWSEFASYVKSIKKAPSQQFDLDTT